MGKRLFKYLKNNDFDKAAGLFHYSPDFSKKEKITEKKHMKEWLVFIRKEFGRIESYKNASPVKCYQVIILPQDFKYWKKIPLEYSLVYKVQFSKLGEGYIAIDYSYIKNIPEIRTIHYGLPLSKSGSKKIIYNIGNKMLNIMKSRKKN